MNASHEFYVTLIVISCRILFSKSVMQNKIFQTHFALKNFIMEIICFLSVSKVITVEITAVDEEKWFTEIRCEIKCFQFYKKNICKSCYNVNFVF